jgi:hypothetical protein
MRTMLKFVLVLGSIGALALGTSVPVRAQYYPPPRDYDAAPDYDAPRDYDGPRDYDAPRDYDRPRNYYERRDHDVARDYDGPRDHDGWRDHDAADGRHGTWNGCPPNWTVQGGECKPYKGPSVEDRTHGTVVRRDTRYRAASVSRILDHVSQMAAPLAGCYAGRGSKQK